MSISCPDIADVMTRYADGDDAAFAELYDFLAPRLYGYVLRRTGRSACAEDLLQQTLLNVHRARGSFNRGADVLPWVFSIARRLLIDKARNQNREPVVDESAGLDLVEESASADVVVE